MSPLGGAYEISVGSLMFFTTIAIEVFTDVTFIYEHTAAIRTTESLVALSICLPSNVVEGEEK
jgi:hypothetical protein